MGRRQPGKHVPRVRPTAQDHRRRAALALRQVLTRADAHRRQQLRRCGRLAQDWLRAGIGGLMPYVNRAGLRLFYADSGSGLPVLWHTGGCGDATMWDTAGYLAALPGYRHIMFDHRGHGRSEGPADMAGHHMDCYVDDVIAVLDDAGIGRAVLIGYSQGARVGYAVAAAHSQRLAGLVALDSVPDPEEQAASMRDDAGEVIARGTA